MLDLIHHPFHGALADTFVDPFALNRRRRCWHHDVFDDMDRTVAQMLDGNFGDFMKDAHLQQDRMHRHAIEQHDWARRNIAGSGDGTTAHHVVHRRQHSRDSSGRERFCEHRAIDGRYRTLRWDTNDVDECGEVRRHITSGVEADAGRTSMNMNMNKLQEASGDGSAEQAFDEDAFERDWRAAGFCHDAEASGVPAPRELPTSHCTPLRSQQEQQQQSGVEVTDKDSEGHVSDSPDSDNEDESKMEHEDATPLFETRAPGQHH